MPTEEQGEQLTGSPASGGSIDTRATASPFANTISDVSPQQSTSEQDILDLGVTSESCLRNIGFATLLAKIVASFFS